MNRHERRAALKEQHSYTQQFPIRLTLVSPEEFPDYPNPPLKVWRSRNYLVLYYEESSTEYPGLIRLSVCRSQVQQNGHWKDGIAWEELQIIKSEIGFGDLYGIEVYPRNCDLVNVANFRHLWLLPQPLSIGWFETTPLPLQEIKP